MGFENYSDLLGLALFTLKLERDDAGNAIVEDGEFQYPRLRKFTRNNPDYPHLQGKREWFGWRSGEDRTVVLASDVVFMKALVNTFTFVLFVAPIQAGLALLINQKLRGISVFRAICLMPVVVSIVVVSLLWKFIYSPGAGLLNSLLFVANSLKPDQQLLSDTNSLRAFLPVGDISLQNYSDAFERASIGVFVLNSVIITGVTVLFTLFVCSLAAFSFVFLDWAGKGMIFSVLLATLIIPYETIFIPLLLMVSQLPWIGVEGLEWGWLNTYRVQIISFIADGLSIFLFMYNQYLWPLMVVQAEEIRPVMVGLGDFTDQLNVPWGRSWPISPSSRFRFWPSTCRCSMCSLPRSQARG